MTRKTQQRADFSPRGGSAPQHALVVGTKRSGLAAARLLRAHGAQVRAMDLQPLPPEELAEFAAIQVPVVLQAAEYLGDPDLVVLSPGVPANETLFDGLRSRGVPVIGEVELAAYFLRGPVLGITGSNGKTTTTALAGHLLRESGIACQVGGNIGTAVTALVDTSDDEQWNVLELSSFQLETIDRFRAHVAVCLNVTPDHLDRHGALDNYVAAKRRLFETQISGDFAVLNYDDPVCRTFAAATRAEVFWFSSTQPVPLGVAIENEKLLYCGEPFLGRDAIPLRGVHNLENTMAAALAAHLAGAPLDAVATAVTKFKAVEHRLEFVRELQGVTYFNDSKATNVDATLKAIHSFDGGLWVILGGKDKGSDYRPLREPLRKRARGALLIGAAAPLIENALAGSVPLTRCETLDRAVAEAHRNARPGDTVLLAPACASFDQFKNFEDRGNRFKQLVGELF